MSSEHRPPPPRDPADASWLRLLLVATAALVGAGLVVAAVVAGILVIID